MPKKNKPKIHIIVSLVHYDEINYNGQEFSKIWGVARVGNKIVQWSGNTRGNVVFTYTSESASRAERAKLYVTRSMLNQLTMSAINVTYQIEYTPNIMQVLHTFVASGKRSMTINYRNLL
jgi:hypothetical protein